jgi:deoxyribodipyrimidine photo-lyase
VPDERTSHANRQPPRVAGKFVLYWMQASRRLNGNFALQQAVAWATHLEKPLVILETLPCGPRWASRRHHRFVLDGMADHQDQAQRKEVLYYPYVESEAGQIDKLLDALCSLAAMIVTDDYPIRHFLQQTADLARRSPVLVQAVDSNGLLPMRVADRTFTAAHSLRRFLQRTLPAHLTEFPRRDPLAHRRLPSASLPKEIQRQWPAATPELLAGDNAALDRLPIDRQVSISQLRGGPRAAQSCLREFLASRLSRYVDERNDPDAEASSGLSPYLHFGHISAHEIFHALARREQWSPDRLAEMPTGTREHWWGMSPAAEAFLDELVTWRELGFNLCSRRADYDAFASLPDWAQATLAKHAKDRRPFHYSFMELESAQTHDSLWNAAQRQLLREGRLHNYLRMLWGKKILEWTESPTQALETMLELNNKYALDGEDPNSYSGVFWVLGRYDRAWGPERPIFGKIRYMSSDNTAKKVRVRNYLEWYGE